MSLALLIPFLTSAILGLALGPYFSINDKKLRPVMVIQGVLVVIGQIYLVHYLLGNLYDSNSIFYPISYTCIYFFFMVNQKSTYRFPAFVLASASIFAVIYEQGEAIGNYFYLVPIPLVMAFVIIAEGRLTTSQRSSELVKSP